LRDVGKQYSLKSGVGTYWHTHEVNLLGNSKTPVRAFKENMQPYHWVNSLGFYREDFNFIVVRDINYSIDMDLAEKILGHEFLFKYRCTPANTDIYVLTPAQELKMAEHLREFRR
jgi:hypothetical protein